MGYATAYYITSDMITSYLQVKRMIDKLAFILMRLVMNKYLQPHQFLSFSLINKAVLVFRIVKVVHNYPNYHA